MVLFLFDNVIYVFFILMTMYSHYMFMSGQNPQRRGTACTLPNFYVVLCIFVLFYVFLCCSMYFLCCSMYFCVVLCIVCVVLCIVCFVSFPVLFVCISVLYYCHRVATQLQLNIYHILSLYESVRSVS